MNARLLAALQRGGSASQKRDGVWCIRRGHDLRTRIIGELDDAPFQSLRLTGHVKRLGDGADAVWVWCGPLEPVQKAAPDADTALQACAQTDSKRPYIARVLLMCDASKRRQFVTRMRAFLEDYEELHTAPALAGMNWRDLGYGTRIDATSKPGRKQVHGYRQTARRRLQKLRHALGDGDWQTWLRTAVLSWSERDFARRGGVPPATLRRHLDRILVVFADIYTADTGRV